MLAVLGGHTDCVTYLLEKGALPDAKDKRGSTALHRGVGLTLSISFIIQTPQIVFTCKCFLITSPTLLVFCLGGIGP